MESLPGHSRRKQVVGRGKREQHDIGTAETLRVEKRHGRMPAPAPNSGGIASNIIIHSNGKTNLDDGGVRASGGDGGSEEQCDGTAHGNSL